MFLPGIADVFAGDQRCLIPGIADVLSSRARGWRGFQFPLLRARITQLQFNYFFYAPTCG
jgi:hypothetical protein